MPQRKTRKRHPGMVRLWREKPITRKQAVTDLFDAWCLTKGLPQPVSELRFHETRRWRFDYAWPKHRVALEVEGGVWTGGRHTSGIGFVKDMDKYNNAALLGWRVLRVQPRTLLSEETAEMLRTAFAA